MRDIAGGPGPQDDGFTLVELLVAIVLLGVIGSMVTTSVVAASRAAIHAESRIEATTHLHSSMANISRQIRSAQSADSTVPNASLRVASPTSLEFDLFRNDRRERVTLSVNGNELRETRRRFPSVALSNPLPAPTTRTLLRGLQDLDSRPVFSYWNSAGTCLAGCAGNLTTSLSGAVLPDVVELRVVLRRGIGLGRAPIEVETRIALRNA